VRELEENDEAVSLVANTSWLDRVEWLVPVRELFYCLLSS